MSSPTAMANPSLSSPATVYHHHSLNRRHFFPFPSQSISISSNNFRLVSLCCQTPDIAALSDSSSSSSPSPSSAIDFLTLCHRLKVLTFQLHYFPFLSFFALLVLLLLAFVNIYVDFTLQISEELMLLVFYKTHKIACDILGSDFCLCFHKMSHDLQLGSIKFIIINLVVD